jgi:tRNA dimethylallyltransferase
VTLLVIVGPTASAKTELAVELASRHPIEIISADSVQVYRHFDLGTGKPTAMERAQAPHHLLDCVEPMEPMDAARWARLADGVLEDIRARGRIPVVCGGSFLYVKALLFGLAAAPPADENVRLRHARLVAGQGKEALHAALSRVDPTSAARLNPNDRVRVSRALEVFELTGVPLSRWQAEHGFSSVRHRAKLVGVGWSREQLDERIRTRADAMLAHGWVEEVERLLEMGYAESRPMRSVGYRQIADALTGEAPVEATELRERIVRATRVFARRQRTWLRDQPVRWLPPSVLGAVDAERLLA